MIINKNIKRMHQFSKSSTKSVHSLGDRQVKPIISPFSSGVKNNEDLKKENEF